MGRDTELALLEQTFLHQSQHTIAIAQRQTISGLGGIGKTVLAIKYAYLHHRNYQAVLWVRANTTETLLTSFIDLARLLNLPEKDEPEATVIREAVKAWLQIHDRWLLIFDNAEEPTLLHDFFPANVGGHILITTRAQVVHGAISVDLDVLDEQTGALFLLHRSRPKSCINVTLSSVSGI